MPSYLILLVYCFAITVWIFSDVDKSIFHPVTDARDKSIKEAKSCFGSGHFALESFDQAILPRSTTGMFALNHMLHCLVFVAERALIRRMHAESMKLVEGWKYIVTYFCEKYITIYPVDGE